MKIIAKYIKHLFNAKHQAELTLLVENYRHTVWLEELDQDEEYSVEIKKVKSKRSLQQNKYLWALIRELALKTRELDMDLYIKLLIETDAEFEYIWAMEKTEDSLKKVFRAIKRVKPQRIKDSDGWLYKCYLGSSKFTVEEMNQLLDTLIKWCIEEGIETGEEHYG